MLTLLEVKNYRSVGDLRMELGAINLFIGPNSSGKSNILDVLSFVSEALVHGLPAAVTARGGIHLVRRHSNGHPFNMTVTLGLALDGHNASYSFTIKGSKQHEYQVKEERGWLDTQDGRVSFARRDGQWSGPAGLAPRVDDQALALSLLAGDERFKPLADALASMIVYSIYPDMLRAPQRFEPSGHMRARGENWATVLREMGRVEPRACRSLVKALGKLTGDVEDVQVVSAAGHLIVQFKQGGPSRERWVDASAQSDGTLRVAGILTALLQHAPMTVLAIEEPELTVHIGALPMLRDYLIEASEHTQLMFTTHSPQLLDAFEDVSTLHIFSVVREQGVTRAKRLSEHQLQPVVNRLMTLGELLVSGDSGALVFADGA